MPRRGEGIPSGFTMTLRNDFAKEILQDYNVKVWPRKLAWTTFKGEPDENGNTIQELSVPEPLRPTSVTVDTLGSEKWGLKITWFEGEDQRQPAYTRTLEWKADVSQPAESDRKYYLSLVPENQ